MLTSLLKTAVFSLGLAALAGSAAAGEITGDKLQWKPYWHATCAMRLDRAYQDGKDAPLTIVITNTSKITMEYKITVRTSKAYYAPTKQDLSMNATIPGQTRTLKTKAYAGIFDGGTLFVEPTYCKVK
jgi:hypothetical protein